MKLSIGILISNRINVVPKVMESLKPMVDAGIAEIVAVDTVSETPGMVSDGSFEVVKKYTTNLHSFPWIRDFSAARNLTLQYATGEWYMFVDDDEWFEDSKEIVDFFESGEYKKYESASYFIRNYKNPEGTEWTDTRAVRLVRRTADLKFIGRIHETYNELRLPCREFSCFAHHYGYAFANEEEKKAHRERNLSLLEEELSNCPNDLRLHGQMALELSTFDNERALKFVRSTLERFREKSTDPVYQWLVSLQFPLYEALGRNAEEAESLLSEIKKAYKLSESAELAICYSMARINLLEKRVAGAGPHIDRYFVLLKILRNDREKAMLQNSADFAKYLSKELEQEMRQFQEVCMNTANGHVKMENGTISFGRKKFELNGTTEEKLAQLNEMNFDDFTKCVDQLVEESAACFEDVFLSEAMVYFEQENRIEYCYLLYKCAETEIKRAVANGASGAAISELLTECILTERQMYEMLYRPEVFTPSGLGWLPVDVSYNDVLYRFVSGGGKELNLILEAAKLRPDMVQVLKAWLGALS